MEDKSLEETKTLPEDESQEDTQTDGGNEESKGLSAKEDQEGVSPKEKKGFQRLVAKKDREILKLQERVGAFNTKLSDFEQKDRQRKLGEMDELTKWKTLANENAEKAAKAGLKNFVSTELAKRGLLNHPVADLIMDTPWAVPAIKSKLSTEPTWDETIQAVESNLGPYLESLEQPKTKKVKTDAETDLEGMEEDKSTSKPIKRIWTRAEVKDYLESSDGREDFRKRQLKINKALTEGRIR